MRTMPQCTNVSVLHTIDLGQHHLLLMSDQSLDLMPHEHGSCVAERVLRLDSCEVYRLLISLQEIFKEAYE